MLWEYRLVSLLQIMQQMEATLINTIATMLQTGVIGTYNVIHYGQSNGTIFTCCVTLFNMVSQQESMFAYLYISYMYETSRKADHRNIM